MNKTVRTTFSNIFTVFCCVLVVLGIVSLVGVGMGLRPFVMISESMHPEVTKGSLVLINTSAPLDKVEAGDNVAYIVGKVEAMHKVVSTGSSSSISSISSTVSTVPDENLSGGDGGVGEKGENESTGNAGVGEAGEKTLVVRSLADEGTSVVSADMYLGKEVMSIAGVGGWIREIVKYKWIVIGLAGVLIVAGCIPKKNGTATPQTVQEQS
ncbi:MAG: hypothetical protein IJX90_11135 [Blautia sp.]|nr:hypothetical protein [Blautia sp.]